MSAARRSSTRRASAGRGSNLEEAAEMLAPQPVAIQLRYLQTLVEIGAEKNTTIVFPLPMELISLLGHGGIGKLTPAPPETK